MISLVLQFILSIILLIILPIICFKLLPTDDKIYKRIEKNKKEYNFEDERDSKRFFNLIFNEYFLELFYDESIKYVPKDGIDFYTYSKNKFLKLPTHEKEKYLEKKELIDINYYINKIQLAPMLFVTSVVIYFMTNLFQILQIIIFSPYKFLITESIIMWFFPILLFSICISVPLLLKVAGNSTIKSKIGEKYFNKMLIMELNSIRRRFGIRSRIESKVSIGPQKKFKTLVIVFGVVFFIFLTFLISHNAIIRDDGIYASSWWSYEHKYCSWNDVTDIYYEVGRIKTDSNEIYEHETPYVVIVSNGELILSFSTNERFSYLESCCYQIERHGKQNELIDYIKLKTGLDFEEVVFDRNTNQYIRI